jgi:AcrR family transcriptional regulator
MATPASDPDAVRPRSPKGVQTRARLVDAAKNVFEDDGFLDARISDIAERAGLSHGAFYHYFESKDEVFREVAEMMDDRLSAPLDSVILDPSSGAPPEQRIREALTRHLESYRAEARIMGVIEQVSRYDDQVGAMRFERHQQYTKRIADSIRQMQRHELVDKRLKPQIAAAILGGMTQRFAEMWLVQGFVQCSMKDAVDQLTSIFVGAFGIGSETGRGARPERARR